jgi:uncharacterized protein YbaR (Trm112 family)
MDRVTHRRLDELEAFFRPLIDASASAATLTFRDKKKLLQNACDLSLLLAYHRDEEDDDVQVTFAEEFEAGAHARAKALLEEIRVKLLDDMVCPICHDPLMRFSGTARDIASLDHLSCGHTLHASCMATYRRTNPAAIARLTTACGVHGNASQEELRLLLETKDCGTCFSRTFPAFGYYQVCPECRAESRYTHGGLRF